MARIILISLLFMVFLSFKVFGQDETVQKKPDQSQVKSGKKEIKNVPATETKAKPGKISSAARPSSIKPNQPGTTGKPNNSGNPKNTVKPPARGKPASVGKPPGGN
ncbi:MAG: hypothetical protein MUC73_00665 [Cyclobacteriaceae bacterium]|jgi:hypothetical protein|nr:hypothetical protein [Cyclobacteriaceae bacterium]